MESVDAKLARAKVHLQTFQKDAAQVMENARPTIIRKVNQAQTEHWLVIYSKDPFPPIELSVLVGDCLFNLRSALDNLICGLVRTENPRSSCSGRQFSICKDRDTYASTCINALKGVPKEARAIVGELQPFHRPENARELDPLWILNTLCNRDKHRAANLTLGYHKNVEILVPLKNGASWFVQLTEGLYLGNVDTVPLRCDPDLVDDNVRVQIKGRSVLTFRSVNPWADRPVDEILTTCLQHVEDRVIARFKPFFRR
jgi:hypothetical protein